MVNNMAIYDAGRKVPEEAKKPIMAGRLKGFTDINPMWRFKVLTELFGACGIGWTISEPKFEFVNGNAGEVMCMCSVTIRVKADGEWSEPIPGVGGSMFIQKERDGLRTNDEAPKMALTDALSVACKELGIGADVYFANDRDKYTCEPPKPVSGHSTASQGHLASAEQIGTLKMMCTPEQIAAICKKYGAQQITKLTEDQAAAMIKAMEKRSGNAGAV